MKRIITFVMVAFLVSSFVFAGGQKEESSSDGRMVLTMTSSYTKEESATDNTRKMPREAILEYAELNANTLDLQVTEFQHNDYETVIQARAAADDLADVFIMKGSWVKNFYDSGLIADLTEYVEACPWLDEYRDGLFFPATVDGKIMATPMQFSTTSVVFYNKELWAAAGYDEFPSTWEEVFAAIPKFEEMGVYPIAFGNRDKWQFNSSWISPLGPRFCGEDWVNSVIAGSDEVAFTDPEFIKLLEFVVQLGQSGLFNPDYSVVDNQNASSLFLQGKAATTIDGYWNVEYMAGIATPDILENVGFAYMPTVEGGIGDSTSASSGCGWFCGVNSKLTGERLAKAADLALYISGPALSQRMTDVGLVSTCNTPPSEGVEFDTLHENYLAFVDNATSTVPIWDANMNASLIAVMNDQFVELLAGRTTPEAAAEVIQAEYEATR